MTLLLVGSGTAASWTVSEAVGLATSRPSPDAAPRHLLLTEADELRAVRAALRARPRALRRGVVVARAADRERLARALSAVDLVAVPNPEAAPAEIRALAAACGRHVAGADAIDRPRRDVVDAARGDRHRFATGQPVTPWTTGEPPLARVRAVRESRKVVVAGHELKFAGGLIDRLRADGHDVRVDQWNGHERHDEAASRALAEWADVVHCEWSLGNLVWYSKHVPPDTRLTSRLHLQEAATPFPARVRTEAVDAWIFVAEHVREQVLRDVSFPRERTHWIPNTVRVPDTSRVAHPGSSPDRRFILGLVGVLPERKGLHRALDVLSLLRDVDPRYRLRIRGHRPRDLEWLRDRAEARAYYAAQEDRLAHDSALSGAVTWDAHGPDMSAWFAQVGVALSTSDFESFHFTLPDGTAHGCLPRSLSWAGADRLYPTDWLEPTVQDLAASIRRATMDESVWRRRTDEARRVIASTYDEAVVLPRLVSRVLGDSTP